MKTLNITFTDDEFKKLQASKKNSCYTDWHAFILNKCSKGHSTKKDLKLK